MARTWPKRQPTYSRCRYCGESAVTFADGGQYGIHIPGCPRSPRAVVERYLAAKP